MTMRKHRWAFLLGCLFLFAATMQSQVFVVGEKTATDGLSAHFTPTNLPLPSSPMQERGRRGLIRTLVAEQGFAHCALPMGAGLTLHANGPLESSQQAYRELIYRKGQAAAPGDRVVVTALTVKDNKIVIDLNGGPYAKHRFLRHIQFNDNPVVADRGEEVTGSRVTLLFDGAVPDLSAAEVKALLTPVIDFGVKSATQAYADTLPPLLRDAIAAHEVLVGMNHRMVLAAMGEPESKIRDQEGGAKGEKVEEWIYGHEPQTIHFIKFSGDRVTTVEIAALGKPLVIHSQDELGGDNPAPEEHQIAMGDPQPGSAKQAPPTLRKPGEAAPPGSEGKVQFPSDNSNKQRVAPIPPPPSTDVPMGTGLPHN